MGTNWLNKLGIVILVLGIAFFLGETEGYMMARCSASRVNVGSGDLSY